MNKSRRSRGIYRFFAIFQLVVLITILVSQFTFKPLSADAAYSKDGINFGTSSTVKTTSKAQQYIAQLGGFLDPNPIGTIGDFLGLGRRTNSKVEEAIRATGGETRETLREFTTNLNNLIATLSSAYQDNLNVTVNSLDEFTRRKIEEMTSAIEKVNQRLQEDIRLISEESQKLIKTTSQEIQQVTKQLEESLKNVIIVGAESTAYVIDRTAYNAVMFTALGMLGVGLLFFIWLLFTDNLPVGVAQTLVFVFGAIYISVFGSMALLPPVRTYAMIYSGVGLQDRLLKSSNPNLDQPREENITNRFIKNSLSGKCIDVAGAPGNTNGASLILYDCEVSGRNRDNGSDTDQKWTFTSDGFIKNSLSGKCIDVAGAPGNTNGASLILYDCEVSGRNRGNGSETDQKWTFTSDGFIKNSLSGKCVDVTGAPGNANGAPLILYDCEVSGRNRGNGSETDQRWSIQ